MDRTHPFLSMNDQNTLKNIIDILQNNSNASDLVDFLQTLSNKLLSEGRNERQEVLEHNVDRVHVYTLGELIIQFLFYNEFPNTIIWKDKNSTNNNVPMIQKDTINELTIEFDKFNVDHTLFIRQNKNAKDHLNNLLCDKESKVFGHLSNGLYELESKLVKLLGTGKWSVSCISRYIHSLDSPRKIQALTETVNILIDYNLREEEEILKVFNESHADKLAESVLQYAINKRFSGTFEKLTNTLLNELKEENKNRDVKYLCDLKKAHYEVEETYKSNSSLISANVSIQNWEDVQVNSWATQFKGNKECDVPQAEKIAVLQRCLELSSNNRIVPRSIQIMSVLLMLNPTKDKGRLAQINTGEGKSSIIAMTAAYHALHGHQVDIVTTSPVLAEPQCKQFQSFYKMLGLTASHNCHDTNGYSDDICYGPILNFQADALREKCGDSKRRRHRAYDIVIVDEVDSMFIDGNDHVVLLGVDMPGMNNLETLLAVIAIQVELVVSRLQENEGVIYYLEPESRIGDDGALKEDEDVNAIPLRDCTVDKFIKRVTITLARRLVRADDDGEEDAEVQIPNHLRDFVCNVQIPEWVDSAIRAKYLFENTKQYVIRDDKVMPVDADNTGVVQPNQHWDDGLHQFLQLKEGRELYPECLPDNYISNIAYFRMYGSNIYGLTGTLGDESTITFLESVYAVDTVIIPPFKQKQHVELEPVIIHTDTDYYSEIARNCISKLNCQRAVLVIMNFIKDIDELHSKFIEMGYDKSKIHLFKTEEEANIVDRTIGAGEVILTTNVAGRGTDIRVASSVEATGGLHVCLTFLPTNWRVEMQNVGRTSRTGNRGTSQFIILNEDEEDMTTIREERDASQVDDMEEANRDVEIIETREIIFTEFLRLLDKLNGRSGVKSIELIAVKERFALWLKMNDTLKENHNRSEVLEKFEDLKNMIIVDDQRGKLIKNPYFHVKIGNIFLKENDYESAIKEFSRAIKLDCNFAEHAHYNRGYCLLAQYSRQGGDSSLIDDAIRDLRSARRLIRKRETDLHLIQRASSSDAFSQQIQRKMNLYNIQKQAIDVAIGPDVEEINEQIKYLQSRLELITEDSLLEIENIKKEIESLKKDKKAVSEGIRGNNSDKPCEMYTEDVLHERIASTTKKNEKERKNINNEIKSLNENKKQRGVIDNVRDKERDFEIKLESLEKCLPEDERKSYRNELDEFGNNGSIGGFTVSEIKPIEWKAVFGVMMLGLGQLIAGAALFVYTAGAGAVLAMSIISEGICDIITAIKDGIINRDFSWAAWAIQKAINYTVAVVCAGMAAIRDVAKTVYSGAKMLGRRVIDEGVKRGWKYVAKKVGFELTKGVAKELITDLAEYGIDKTLIPQVQEELINIIEDPICTALLNNPNVKKMLTADEKNKNNKYEEFIRNTALKILSDKDNKNTLLGIAVQIGDGIAERKIKYYKTTKKITNALCALKELATFVANFTDKLNEQIKKKADQDFELEEEKSDNTDEEPTVQPEENVKSAKPSAATGKLLTKVIVNAVSEKMISTIKTKFIKPPLEAGADYSVDRITKDIDKKLNESINNYKASRRNIHYQD